MAGVSLTGLASGLDTESIVSQLMALEQNKVTARPEAADRRPAAQGRPQRDQDQARRLQDRGRRAQRARDLEGDPDLRLVGPDQGRRDAARRRRHRRSLDLGREARVLGPARLHVHALRHRRLDRPRLLRRPGEQDDDRHPGERDGRRTRDRDQRQRRPRRSTPPWSRTASTSGSSSRPARPASALTSRSPAAACSPTTAPIKRPDLSKLDASYSLDGGPVLTSKRRTRFEHAIPGLRVTLKAVTASTVTVSTAPSPRSTAARSRTRSEAFVTATNAADRQRARQARREADRRDPQSDFQRRPTASCAATSA